MYELHFLQVWCAVALGAGRAGAWPAAWRLRLEQRDRVEVADVRLDEGFGGAGDEMVAPGAARALGLAVDGERMRPLHDMLQQRLPTHPLRLPWDEVVVSREEVAALQQRLERRRLSVADGSGRRHQRGDDASAGADEDADADVDVEVDEDYPDAEWPSDGHAAALRPRAADAAGATVASPSTASPDYDYSRLRAEARAREAAALRRAGVRGSTEPPPPRRRPRLSWRAWLLRELFAWGSAADMQCERMFRWHVGARALRCHAQDALAHLSARSGAPLRDRLQGARESLGRLLLPLSFWCTVYALWAVPLWCTRGWCCCWCYCCCHFCRPDASLDEVRAYTGLNPPGVWRAKGGDAPVFYAPSQREVDAYGRLYKKLRNVLL